MSNGNGDKKEEQAQPGAMPPVAVAVIVVEPATQTWRLHFQPVLPQEERYSACVAMNELIAKNLTAEWQKIQAQGRVKTGIIKPPPPRIIRP